MVTLVSTGCCSCHPSDSWPRKVPIRDGQMGWKWETKQREELRWASGQREEDCNSNPERNKLDHTWHFLPAVDNKNTERIFTWQVLFHLRLPTCQLIVATVTHLLLPFPTFISHSSHTFDADNHPCYHVYGLCAPRHLPPPPWQNDLAKTALNECSLLTATAFT